eukprot:GEZU01039194.1.p1 GENE.GEZU01039194.1~~GEZU01039194.1.p1  ORF type:complete len:320 (+),score=60.10 GEZU01039194.1:135-1094(+)
MSTTTSTTTTTTASILLREFVVGKDCFPENLPLNYWLTILASASMFAFCFFVVADVLSRRFRIFGANVYPKLSRSDQVEWRSRFVSNINAVITFYGGVRCFFFEEAFKINPVFGRSPLADFFLCISVGYFCYDICAVLRYYPKLGGIDMICHHIFGGGALFISMLYKTCTELAILFLATEATTPFVNQRWFFEKCGMKTSKRYLINGILMWLGFLIMRVPVGPFIIAHGYIHRHTYITMVPPGIVLLIAVVNLVINSLNLLWFLKITRGLVKVMTHNSSTAATTNEANNANKTSRKRRNFFAAWITTADVTQLKRGKSA